MADPNGPDSCPIWVSVQTLSGTGTVQASGGNGDGNSGGGSGGRIAIYYEDASAFSFSIVAVPGGGGLGTGGNSSVFLQQTSFNAPLSPGSLVIASIEKPASFVSSRNFAGQSPSGQWVLECIGPANAQLTLE